MALIRWSVGVPAVCVAIVAGTLGAAPQASTEPRSGRLLESVKPSETDPEIQRFDVAHYILFDADSRPDAHLLVFLPGTGGEPPGPVRFLNEAADAGYRVISLAYNDTPAINVYCPTTPDLACTEKFREMRIFGDGIRINRAIDNTSAESIVNRLVQLLRYLDQHDPERKWNTYLKGGTLNWSRIVFAGQSQGAGMAAFIAKQQLVARAILFSSPWDYVVAPDHVRQLAPWLSKPSKTPPQRWFAGYHERELMADLLAGAYAKLQVPPDHIRIFRLDLPAPPPPTGSTNPFHGQGITNPAYAEQRAFFLGRSP